MRTLDEDVGASLGKHALDSCIQRNQCQSRCRPEGDRPIPDDF
jgi:hypothetical protein